MLTYSELKYTNQNHPYKIQIRKLPELESWVIYVCLLSSTQIDGEFVVTNELPIITQRKRKREFKRLETAINFTLKNCDNADDIQVIAKLDDGDNEKTIEVVREKREKPT